MNLQDKKLNFASREVQAAAQLLEALEAWRNLRKEWDASSYGTVIEDEDIPANSAVAHVDADKLTAGFVTADAIEGLLAANGNAHYGNLFALVP